MATSSNPGSRSTTQATRKPSTAAKKATPRARRTTTAQTRRTTTSQTTNSTQPKTPVEHVQVLAERVLLVPVGASLLARDNLVSTVRGLATKYRTRAGVGRELKRYERRGVTARNRLEREVRRTRARVERELRQRRTRVERTVKQNRRRLEREVRTVRRDLEKQSGFVTARATKLFSEAQERLGAVS